MRVESQRVAVRSERDDGYTDTVTVGIRDRVTLQMLIIVSRQLEVNLRVRYAP